MNLQGNITGVFSKKQKIAVLVTIAAVILCIITAALGLTIRGKEIAMEEVEEYLSELSYQTSYKVNQRVAYNFEVLTMLKNNLEDLPEHEHQKLMDTTLTNSAFDEIGYINSQGILNGGNRQIDVSKTNIMTDLKEQKTSISSTLVETEDGKKGIVYAIFSSKEGTMALGGWIPTDTMLLLMNTDTFEGIGFSHIISNNGDYILSSQNENAVLNKGTNFLTELLKFSPQEETDAKLMKEQMQKGKSGTMEYEIEGVGKRSLTYTPLEKGDWYLLSIVPSNTYVYDIKEFTGFSILLIAIVSISLFSIVSIAIMSISTRKNKIISNIAYVDPVTKGMTRARFDQKIRDIMNDFTPFSYIMLDIRKFKLINDLMGSKGGDDVLRHVYQCILKHLDEDEFVSRVQADYFEVIVRTIDKENISKKLLAIAKEINQFNETREHPYYLPIDCGIYIVDEVTDDLVLVRDRANAARKNNKETSQTHLCSCVFYNDLQRLQMVQEKEIDNAMEKALRNEEFMVYLQPKVDIKTNKIAGAEALIRWNSPTMGFLSPDTFIPYFEKTGFIVKLDEFVFEKVCQHLKSWLDQGVEPVPISVNLSKRDLYDYDYLTHYKEIQERYQVPSKYLEIEFTETMFFENLELLKRSIDEVHEAGYRCSIDDFGSGYSSLALLKEIPVDILKLDKTFFDNFDNPRGDKVVEHVIALAKDLDMATIAEGVETLIQVERLRKMKCDQIQGYVYYKPMCMEDYDKIVEHDFEIIDISMKK